MMRHKQPPMSQEFNRQNNLQTADKIFKANTEGFYALSRTIVRHGLENDIAIALLHKHFRLKSGEVTVGSIIKDRIITTPRKVLSTSSTPWLWKSKHEGPTDWLPIQYIKEPGCNKTLAKRAAKLSRCTTFWKDAAKIIHRHHLADILGLALVLGGPLALNDFQILAEDTDIHARRSITRLVDKQSELSNGIKTLWIAGDPPGPVANCPHCEQGKKDTKKPKD